MKPIKTIHLTGDQEIPGLPFLEYESESVKHWVGELEVWGIERLEGIEICFYGNIEGPQSERIAVAQRIIPVLEALETRACLDLDKQFKQGVDPLDDLYQWTLLSVYFGFLGIEPAEEFSLHFGLGIWDWSTPYFAQYRLNSEDPVKSQLVGFGQEDE